MITGIPTQEQRDAQRKNEALAHPIFLFQKRDYFLFAEPEDHFHDGEGIIEGEVIDNCWHPKEGAEYLTWQQLVDLDCAREVWNTDRVFLSREEAEAYGKRYDYNYGNGWRVYAVPCTGVLANILDGALTSPPPSVSSGACESSTEENARS
jgi:hypothetical protein